MWDEAGLAQPQPGVFPGPEMEPVPQPLDLRWSEVTSVINGVASELLAGEPLVGGAGTAMGECFLSETQVQLPDLFRSSHKSPAGIGVSPSESRVLSGLRHIHSPAPEPCPAPSE